MGPHPAHVHTPHTCTHIYIQHMVSHGDRDPHTHTRTHTCTGVQKPTQRERPIPCVSILCVYPVCPPPRPSLLKGPVTSLLPCLSDPET